MSVKSASSVVVTTSWDDGHVCDHRIAQLLDTYGLRGTFYVAPKNVELPQRQRLSDREVVALSGRFEIGGHTLTHQRLTGVSDDVARREIVAGKDALEQVVGKPLRSFCYPGGQYAARHTAMVRDAGFALARTVRRGVTRSSPAYETHTTVHAYRHLKDGAAALRLARGHAGRARRIYWNWDVLAMTTFDRVVATGGVFHLWGHSWEVDDNRDWGRLERVFRYIGGRSDVTYVDNGDLAIGTR